jgi:RimJ/RimL family protein N-acetyltransferase
MKKKFVLKSERLILRPLELKDTLEYSKLGVSYRRFGKVNTLEKARKWIRKSLKAEDSFDVGIYLSDEMIGTIEFCHMSWFDYKGGEICYTIKKKFRGKGYGTEALRVFVKYCFNEMKLHKVYADTDKDNIASRRILEKVGFKLEGVIRERRKVKGKWMDEYDYGLLRREFSID